MTGWGSDKTAYEMETDETVDEITFLKAMVKHNWTGEQMRYKMRKRINDIEEYCVDKEGKNGKFKQEDLCKCEHCYANHNIGKSYCWVKGCRCERFILKDLCEEGGEDGNN